MRVEVQFGQGGLPTIFETKVKRSGRTWEDYSTLNMDLYAAKPPKYQIANPNRAKRILGQANKSIQTKKWKLENSDGFKSNHLPDPGTERPYAALDYLYLNDPPKYVALRGALGVTPEESEFKIGPGGTFNREQRKMILRVNYLQNTSKLRSDLDKIDLLKGSRSLAPEIDHIVPKKGRSGYNAFSNAQVLSSSQNKSKTSTFVAESPRGKK